MGISVGHTKSQCGTLGCFVKRQGDPQSSNLMILSNNHVIANNNDAKQGDIILQPGRKDGGNRRRDTIGYLEDWIKLNSRGNKVDAAIAKLDDNFIPEEINIIPGIGKVSNVYPDRILPSLKVRKFGRTSSLTHGVVTAVLKEELEVKCKRGIKRGFVNVVEIESTTAEPFSRKGDSGSLIVDEQNRAVALLFAGNRHKTFAVKIAEVVDNNLLATPNQHN